MTNPDEPDKLLEAMLMAFDNRTVEKMLRERLNKNVLDFVRNKELLTDVVKAAAAEGWTEDLIKAALFEQPDSLAVKRVAIN
jgi:hypothetical protein